MTVDNGVLSMEPNTGGSVQSVALTEAERQSISEYVAKLDLKNPDHVLLFGADAQKKIADFSDSALACVKTGDTGEVGEMLVKLVGELKGFDSGAEAPRGMKRLFQTPGKQLTGLKARYDAVEKNVDSIAVSLENYQTKLLKDISMFERLYDTNTQYFRELTLYIETGEEKLSAVRQTDLAALREKAAQTSDAMDAQSANDLAAMCDRFEKKIFDLKLTRQVSMQMAPQIRLLQNNDSLLVERIQSTLSNTLPLWKGQMVLALGLSNSQQALNAQTAVANMTNELLLKNAEMLKIGTVETAREAERGVVDISTLASTNRSLIDTINDVIGIQEEGRRQRVQAEESLARLENELKQKLLEIRR
ncbi:MAG: toxic anion resistance protein [Clostridia bacterium]|nr:toxic anion resistance protein [Clostridia bacterium]